MSIKYFFHLISNTRSDRRDKIQQQKFIISELFTLWRKKDVFFFK